MVAPLSLAFLFLFMGKRIGSFLFPLTNFERSIRSGGEPEQSLNQNNKVLTTNKEDFIKMSGIEIPP